MADEPPQSNRSMPGQVMLEARQLTVGYGAMAVIQDLDLVVHAGEVVALLGVNGAGKTTTVRALAGELSPSSGEVWFRGERTTAPLHKRAKQGMRLITEERSVFMTLSAADNLRLGGQERSRALELFPELERLLGRRAGLLSGGEQQILTLARALAGDPVVLLADELSLGLAPLVVERLLGAVRAAADRGTAVLLVEQQVRNAPRGRRSRLRPGRRACCPGGSDVRAAHTDRRDRTHLPGHRGALVAVTNRSGGRPAGDLDHDIGGVAVFLACSDSDFVTGQSLHVDGGQTLRP